MVLLALAQTGDPRGAGADPAVPAGVPSGGYRHGSAASYVARHLVPLVEQRMAAAPEAFRTGSTGCC
jgi:hypothetical protein